MKTNLKLCLLILALVSLSGFAHAQGTAFSYQGRLEDSGRTATGLYDFTFNAFDVDVDGIALGAAVVLDAVPVTNGLFNVALDFGPGIFTGAARWLEISVRTNGIGEPTLLTPRTPLLPTPYSMVAGGVANGSVTPEQLNTAAPAIQGQFLSYDGGNFLWTDPGVAVGNVWSVLNNNAYYNAGRVGIGTTTPRGALHVSSGGMAITGGSSPYTGAGPGIFMESGPAGGFLFAYDYGAFTSRPLILNSPGGNVGIGTTTPASKLTVRTAGTFNAYGIEHTDGNVRLTTYLDAGNGGWLGTRSNHPLNFFVNDGVPRLTIGLGGETIMTPNGGYGETVFGTPNGESGFSIKNGNRADVRFNGSSIKMVAATGVGPPSAFNGIAVTTAGNVGVGTDAPVAKLDVRGTTRTCILSIVGGCDIAEPFLMKEKELAKGAVVVIDDEHPGQLKLSTQACDTRVAGIVSGANGVNTGIALQQEGTFDQGQNVALSGRVYVQADAAFGAIKPGDLLTTSGTPGHAMKVTDHARSQGAILGKAMSALKEGKGMVLVIVTLQ